MLLTKTSVLVAPVLILLLFGSTLVGIDRLAFRDVSHFYTPLYGYVGERCDEQWLPLWNPLDQTGQPLLGETTTAVLYPVRHLIYTMPLTAESAMAWYVAMHLILSAFAAYLLARWSGMPEIAATAASLVYPLSGSVLFLYTNPPFLVGAAWLPIVLGALITPHAGSIRSRIILGGVAMAMMILGGDPQAALHAMLIAGVITGGRLLRRRDRRQRESLDQRLLVFLAVPIVAGILSLPQLSASISWSRQSDRVRPSTEDWASPPLVGGRRYQAYQYSLPPWHVAEVATPNAFGAFLPINARLSRMLPGDGRSWTPSIYMGALTLIALLAGGWSIGPGPWKSIFLLAIGLSFGHFGLVWFLQAMGGGLDHIDSAVGGPYWMLYEFLPGYDAFRYPAKWLCFVALAASMVTAGIVAQMNQLLVQRIATRLAVIVCIAMAMIQTLRWIPLPGDQFTSAPDEFWGPLQIEHGIDQSTLSLLHSMIVLAAIVLLTKQSIKRAWATCTWKWALVVLLAFDLTVSALGLIYRVPLHEERAAMNAIGALPDLESGTSWMRTQSGHGWPAEWRMESDPGRLVDVEASTRAAWFGRWHLASGAHTLNNMVSIRSQASADFWAATGLTTRKMKPEQRDQFWLSIRNWLGIPNVLHTSDREVAAKIDHRVAALVNLTFAQQAEGWSLRAYPRWRSQSRSVDTEEMSGRLKKITQAQATSWHERQSPIISSALNVPQPDLPRVQAPDRDSVKGLNFDYKIVSSNPEAAAFEVTVNQKVLITRPTFQDGHWKASYRKNGNPQGIPADGETLTRSSDQSVGANWKSLDVVSVDGITQGVILPAGSWQLKFAYQPTWIGWMMVGSAISWIFLLAITLHWRRDLAASFQPSPDQATDASSPAHPAR